MTRTSISLSDDVFDRLKALKRDGESWTEFGERVADTLEAQDDGVNSDSNATPDDVLTEDHISDIGAEVERRVERTLDNMTRR